MTKRRWFQFSLRGLLLATLVVSLALSAYVYEARRVRQQETALKSLSAYSIVRNFHETSAGAHADLKSSCLACIFGEDAYAERAVEITHRRLTTSQLAPLEHVRYLSELCIVACQFDDEALRFVAPCQTLKLLCLTDTPTSDTGLRYIGEIQTLEILQLDNTAVTDTGLSFVAKLHGLRELHLRNYHLDSKYRVTITSEGLKQLRPLRSLETLRLDGTQVSDEGLLHLRELPSLRFLSLNGTRVTAAGVKGLRGAPNLEEVLVADTSLSEDDIEEVSLALPGVAVKAPY